MTHPLPPDEILPCPFDGENASAHQDEKEWWKIACEKCGARILSIYPTEDSAIEAWNTRAHLSAPPAGDDLVEKLEAAICRLEGHPWLQYDKAIAIVRAHHAAQAEIIRGLSGVLRTGLHLKGGWREAIVELEDHTGNEVLLRNMLAAADQLDEWAQQAKAALAASERYAPDTSERKG